jgi:ATP-binding cassette subfamily B protein
VTLSGGQKQRISLARALLKRPRMLVLDDAFSSVDTATESVALANVRAEMKGRTMIVVSHRVSTVKDCDAVVVLEGGTIAERGGHEELIALGGYYSTLYELQKLEEKVVR